MTMHQSELQRQSAAYADIRNRLLNPAPSRKAVEKLENRVSELQGVVAARDEEILSLATKLDAGKRDAQATTQKLRQKLERLMLDHADLHAAFIEQVKRLADMEDSLAGNKDYPLSRKRAVADIVSEVLVNYPGVTWDDIRSHRRTPDMVEPRRACVKAVHEQRPDLSSPAIGRIFNRDHTSILYIVGTIKKGKK